MLRIGLGLVLDLQDWLGWLRVGVGLLRVGLLHSVLIPEAWPTHRKKVLNVKKQSP